jgi:signal peptidase I
MSGGEGASGLPAPPSRRRRVARLGAQVVGLAFDLALVAILVLLVFVAYGLIDNRWYHAVAVKGGSMAPTILPGDLIVITRPPERIEPGMILTLEVDDAVVTHRVVEVRQDGTFVTKGDANDVRDDFSANAVRVVGQYQLRIPFAGGWLPTSERRPVDASGAWFASDITMGASGAAGAWEVATPTEASERTLETPAPGPSSRPDATPQTEPPATPIPGLAAPVQPTPGPMPEPPPGQSPTPEPSVDPTALPEPTMEPTTSPTPEPSVDPNATPGPTVEPSSPPAPEPSVDPTPIPEATIEPSPTPTPEPTLEPSPSPTPEPALDPTPTPEPTLEPSSQSASKHPTGE